MLEVVGQDIISGNMGFIGTDPGREYQMGTAEKTEDVTVTGNPAVLDNATGKPFKDLHIYGRSEQMTTTGAQLLDLSDLIGKTETKNGATYKINEDQSITVSGTPTEYTSFYLKEISLKAGSYYFLRNSDDKVFVQLIGAKADMNNGFTLDEDTDNIGVYVVFNVVSNNTESFNMTFTSMLNAGDTALPWEPYTGGKPSPSPDYPQEIVSAGEDGNLNVMVRGKNIFPGPEQPKTVEKNGLTFSYKDGMYTLVGTSNTDTWFNIYPNIRNSTSTADTGGTIHSIGKVAVANGLKNESCTINIRDANIKDKTENITSSNNKKHLSFDTNGAFAYVRPGTYSETFTLMIVDENQAEDYEPYHTPQTLTLSAPNGLPGIPVTSGGNYTDENGQQWICDEVDFGRGVYVQRVYTVDVDGVNAGFSQAGLYCNMNLRKMPSAKPISTSSKAATAKSTFTSEEWNFNQEYGFLYFAKENYAEILNESCKKHPGEVIYALTTPIETPLTTAEISAYKSLRTYRGTTIVEAEDKAGISVTYKRNAKTDNISAEKKIEGSEKKEYDES